MQRYPVSSSWLLQSDCTFLVKLFVSREKDWKNFATEAEKTRPSSRRVFTTSKESWHSQQRSDRIKSNPMTNTHPKILFEAHDGSIRWFSSERVLSGEHTDSSANGWDLSHLAMCAGMCASQESAQSSTNSIERLAEQLTYALITDFSQLLGQVLDYY